MKVDMITDQGEDTGVKVMPEGGINPSALAPLEPTSTGGEGFAPSQSASYEAPMEPPAPEIELSADDLEYGELVEIYEQPEAEVVQQDDDAIYGELESDAPALQEDPDIVGDRLERVRTYFGRIEGTRPHVGADAQNLTLPFGIVPDSVMVNGVEVRAGQNTLSNSVLESNPDQVQLMTAVKKVGGREYKASDYNSYEEFSDAVLGAFEQELVAKMPDLPEAALPTMLSSMWNAGVGSGMQNWSGFQATVAELKKPEGSRNMHDLVAMGKHSFTGGKSSVGLLKRRMEDLNLSLPPSEQIAKVDQRTINGKPVMRVFDRDGNVIRTFNFNKASINNDQEINLEIDPLDEVQAESTLVDLDTQRSELPTGEGESAPDATPQPTVLGDGIYEDPDTGKPFRMQGGRMYDLRTGERLDVDPIQDTGPDVGTIESTMTESRQLDGSAQDNLAGSGNADAEGMKTFLREITGANLGPNVMAALDEGDTQGAVMEAALEILPPGLEEAMRSMLLGIKTSKLGKSPEGQAKVQQAEAMEAEGIPEDVIWKETGMERGAEGEWMFEVDDSLAEIVELPRTTMPGGARSTLPLNRVMKHDLLYEQHPELANVQVAVYDSSHGQIRGSDGFAREGEFIGLNSSLKPAEQRRVLLHETEHIIQSNKFEDWVSGTLPKVSPEASSKFSQQVSKVNMVAKSVGVNLKAESKFMVGAIAAGIRGGEAGVEAYYKMLADADIIGAIPDDFRKQRAVNWAFFLKEGGVDVEAFADIEKTLKDDIIPAYSDYYRDYGETLARNVEIRDKMTAAERKAIRPSQTQDVPNSRVQGKDGKPL